MEYLYKFLNEEIINIVMNYINDISIYPCYHQYRDYAIVNNIKLCDKCFKANKYTIRNKLFEFKY
jgi:hypothetical protein